MLGGAASAYWSQSGAGAAIALTGTTSSIVVNQTSTVAGLGPGSTSRTLSGTFTNTGATAVYVTAVNAVVVGTDAGAACDATNFTIDGSAPVGRQIPGSATNTGSWTGLTLAFADKASIQDACKGATVFISYTSS